MTTGFERYSKKTKRALFLNEMGQVVPWGELCSLVEPHYPKAGNGRRPVGIERMLRIYFLQQWFNLSDPAVEEALYDSPLMRGFAGIDLGNEPVPRRDYGLQVPPSSRRTLARRGHAGDGELSFAEPWHQDNDRHDCGCDDHPRSEFDKEPRAEARSRDAPDAQGQAMVCVTNTSANS